MPDEALFLHPPDHGGGGALGPAGGLLPQLAHQLHECGGPLPQRLHHQPLVVGQGKTIVFHSAFLQCTTTVIFSQLQYKGAGYTCQLQIGYKMGTFARAGPLPPVEAHQGLRRGTFCSCRKYPNPKATPLKPYFPRPHFFCLAKRNGVGPPKKSADRPFGATHSSTGAVVTRTLPAPCAAAADTVRGGTLCGPRQSAWFWPLLRAGVPRGPGAFPQLPAERQRKLGVGSVGLPQQERSSWICKGLWPLRSQLALSKARMKSASFSTPSVGMAL